MYKPVELEEGVEARAWCGEECKKDPRNTESQVQDQTKLPFVFPALGMW